MRKICIINQKGGVGKTTTTVNIGSGLSRMNKKVLIIDLDPQAHIATCLSSGTATKDMYSLIVESADIKECVKPLGKNLDIISSDEDLLEAEKWLLGQKTKETILKKKLQGLSGYDYVLIDCPPSLGILTINALMFANEAFIPVSTDFLGMSGLKAVAKLIKNINSDFDHNVRITKIVPTMYDMRSKHSTQVLNELKNEFYELVSDPIRSNTKLKEAPKFGKSIFSYDKNSRGAKDYQKLINSVIYDEKRVKIDDEQSESALLKKLVAA